MSCGRRQTPPPPPAPRRVQIRTDPRYTLSASGLPLALRQTVVAIRFSRIQGPDAPTPYEKSGLAPDLLEPAGSAFERGCAVSGHFPDSRSHRQFQPWAAIANRGVDRAEMSLSRITASREGQGLIWKSAPRTSIEPAASGGSALARGTGEDEATFFASMEGSPHEAAVSLVSPRVDAPVVD